MVGGFGGGVEWLCVDVDAVLWAGEGLRGLGWRLGDDGAAAYGSDDDDAGGREAEWEMMRNRRGECMDGDGSPRCARPVGIDGVMLGLWYGVGMDKEIR